MRLVIAVAIMICCGLLAESRTALGPRRLSSRHLDPVSFRRLDSRAPASITTEHASGRPPELFIQFDEHGLIVQADGDGGDTAQRTGMFYFVYDDPASFARALDQLEVRPGVYVRHPHQHGFRSDPREFSRDQQRALVIALGAYGMTARLWRMTKEHVKRLGKYQNKDFVGPSHVGEYIRAYGTSYLYPVLLVTDFALLLNSARIAIVHRYDPGHSDDNNHVMSLAQARYVMPTPASWLARKIYKKFRPPNDGNFRMKEAYAAHGALVWYHRAENNGNPLIGEAYRNVISNF